MRTAAILFSLALAAAMPAAARQEVPKDESPKKGDMIVVRGCLRGSALESTETGFLDSKATMMTALTYRLTGDKDALKKLREEHNGKVVEVTGILKSSLPPAGEVRGKQFGRTRVVIGAGSPTVGAPARSEANRSIPVLQVKSYEGLAVKCSG
jgi:hypothetical protein